MQKKILIGFLFPLALVVILHAGLLYFVYSYLEKQPFVATAFLILISISFFGLALKGFKQYLALRVYLQSADKLGININFSWQAVSVGATILNKFNFDNQFVGGMAGEGKFKDVKILHQQGKLFFTGPFGAPVTTIFETNYPDNSLSVIISKLFLGSLAANVKSSKQIAGLKYHFFENWVTGKKIKDEDLPDIESQLPDNFFPQFRNLPGDNAVIIQRGKIRLVHKGLVNKPNDIQYFTDAVVQMTK
ncbi:hypothetical protein IT412_05920 [Candidatus Peregrinibacteria bacterium]|nr:hypothetical protein [Candidatus Peregrinibacteria bacterium]